MILLLSIEIDCMQDANADPSCKKVTAMEGLNTNELTMALI